MAAGEEELQPVVGNRAHVVLGGVVPGPGPAECIELAQLVEVAPLATKAVDRPVTRGPDDPCTRVVGEAVTRPALERDRERVLDSLLGDVDVAEDPDQGRDRPPGLVPEQAVDDRVRPGYADRAASFAGFGNPAAS
jgi:hypothetical protein